MRNQYIYADSPTLGPCRVEKMIPVQESIAADHNLLYLVTDHGKMTLPASKLRLGEQKLDIQQMFGNPDRYEAEKEFVDVFKTCTKVADSRDYGMALVFSEIHYGDGRAALSGAYYVKNNHPRLVPIARVVVQEFEDGHDIEIDLGLVERPGACPTSSEPILGPDTTPPFLLRVDVFTGELSDNFKSSPDLMNNNRRQVIAAWLLYNQYVEGMRPVTLLKEDNDNEQ